MRYYGKRLGYFASDVFSINYPMFIKEHKIKAVLLDMDNTTVKYKGRKHRHRTKRLIRYLHRQGIEVWQGTNNPILRDEMLRVGDRSKMYYHTTDGYYDLLVRRNGKPDPDFFLAMCRERNIAPEEVLAVGDNFLRDTIGAMSVGMSTVTVDRYGKDPFFDVVLMTRYFESVHLRDLGVLRIDGKFIRFDPKIASPTY